MRNFTAGPWVVTQQEGTNIYHVHSADGVKLCEVHGKDDDDAHLIASSPGLFQALHDLLFALNGHLNLMPPFIHKAREALAKARGES